MIWRTVGEARFDAHLALCSTNPTRRLYGGLRPALGERLAGKDTDLVLDGFPRSANTYAYAALIQSNGTDLKVSHHLHSAANIVWAVRRSVPTIVLVREPVDAVTSFVQFQKVSAAYGLRRYIGFYERIRSVREGLVVASFSEVTRDFGSVLRRANDLFDIDLEPYDPSPENEAWCRDLVRSFQARRLGRSEPSILALPSQEREAEKSALASIVRQQASFADAVRVHRELVGP